MDIKWCKSFRWHRIGALNISKISITFQFPNGKTFANFDSKFSFTDSNSSFNSPIAMEWFSNIEGPCSTCFSVFQGHLKNFKIKRVKQLAIFVLSLSISELQIQIKFTNCYKIMHKVWSWIEDLPYCFSETSVKFQSHMHRKFKLELQSRNAQFRSKSTIVLAEWPWNFADDLENNRAALLCYFRLCAAFHCHLWIQTWVKVRKHPM